jgi:DNA repair exonuclease SbcCD ATPase subunit
VKEDNSRLVQIEADIRHLRSALQGIAGPRERQVWFQTLAPKLARFECSLSSLDSKINSVVRFRDELLRQKLEIEEELRNLILKSDARISKLSTDIDVASEKFEKLIDPNGLSELARQANQLRSSSSNNHELLTDLFCRLIEILNDSPSPRVKHQT